MERKKEEGEKKEQTNKGRMKAGVGTTRKKGERDGAKKKKNSLTAHLSSPVGAPIRLHVCLLSSTNLSQYDDQ